MFIFLCLLVCLADGKVYIRSEGINPLLSQADTSYNLINSSLNKLQELGQTPGTWCDIEALQLMQQISPPSHPPPWTTPIDYSCT